MNNTDLLLWPESVTGNNDIWRYAAFLPACPSEEFRIPGPSATQIDWLTFKDSGSCAVKREDCNPTGSHKERAACFQVSKYQELKKPIVVIPSSGNAAIAVSAYCKLAGMKALAFLSEKTPAAKIEAVVQQTQHVFICDKPINYAGYISRIFNLPNLRPSIDVHAVTGFMTLGFEIIQQLEKKLHDTAIFIYSTSGASLLGISKAFEIVSSKNKYSAHRRFPPIFAVQSGKAAELAQHFDPRPISISAHSKAGQNAISVSALSGSVIHAIDRCGGGAFYMTEAEIDWGMSQLSDQKIVTSYEGAACLAAVRRWRSAGGHGNPLIILTGRQYNPAESARIAPTVHAGSYQQIRQLVGLMMERVAG